MSRHLSWLNRTLTVSAVHYCLCLSEREFYNEMRRLRVPESSWPPKFLAQPHSQATTYFLESPEGKRLGIVCLDPKYLHADSIQIASLLVHEAVHIWQQHTRLIGSHNDHGDEEEAYAIQSISQALMDSFRKQVYGK